MPIPMNFIEQLGLLYLNKGPGPVYDMLSILGFKAVIVALKLNIFETLDENTYSDKELADVLNVNPDGLSLLLDALLNLGYISVKKNKYRNTPMSKSWMLKRSPLCITDLFFYFEDTFKRWNHLDETIRLGKQPSSLNKWFDKDEENWNRYHAGMKSIAKIVSKDVVKKVKLRSNTRKLLDIGGSHGLYSIHFCRKYPLLTACILDLKASKRIAEDTIIKEGMTNRVRFLEGNFLSIHFDYSFDVLLLFNFIRVFKLPDLRNVLKKCYNLLSLHGVIVILDQFGHNLSTTFTKANNSLIRLELYNILCHPTHSVDKTISLLNQTGFNSSRYIHLSNSGGLGVIRSQKV